MSLSVSASPYARWGGLTQLKVPSSSKVFKEIELFLPGSFASTKERTIKILNRCGKKFKPWEPLNLGLDLYRNSQGNTYV